MKPSVLGRGRGRGRGGKGKGLKGPRDDVPHCAQRKPPHRTASAQSDNLRLATAIATCDLSNQGTITVIFSTTKARNCTSLTCEVCELPPEWP
jgi:hypothetical protein